MITNGSSVSRDFVVDAPGAETSLDHNAAQDADFSALLFLMLAAPAPTALGASDASLVPSSEEDSEIDAVSYGDATAGTAGIVINGGMLDERDARPLTPGLEFSQGIPQPGISGNVEVSIAKQSSIDPRQLLVDEPRGPSLGWGNLLRESSCSDATQMKPSPGAMRSEPFVASDDSLVDGEIISYSGKKISNEVIGNERAANTHEILDRSIFQSTYETEVSSVSRTKDGESTYFDRGPNGPVATVQAKATNPSQTGLKNIEPSGSQVEIEPNSKALARNDRSDEIPTSHEQHAAQEFPFQHEGRKLLNDRSQIDAERSIETAPHPNPFQFVHTKDSAWRIPPRAVQTLDWRPMIDRVVGEVVGRIRIGKQAAVLQLDPPELGKLQIDIYMEGDKISARIVPETQESRTLIEAHLPELRQALSDNRVELVDVRVDSNTWTGQSGHGRHAQQESSSGHQAPHTFNGPVTGNPEEGDTAQANSRMAELGRVSMWA
jgi:hypothetical protein